MGIDERRLRVKWISASEGAEFAEEVHDFNQLLKGLGENPLNTHRKWEQPQSPAPNNKDLETKPTQLTKEQIAEATKVIERSLKEGVKFLNIYYTLGRYDIVVIFEAPNEKTAMKMAMAVGDIESTETLVAVPREEAIKLVE